MSLDDLTAAQARIDASAKDLYAERARLIREARRSGHTWAAIAGALGMKSAHGAIKASKMIEP